jgi:ribonuclease HI
VTANNHQPPTTVAPPDYYITFDGGSKGNPGLGYGSYELRTATGRTRLEQRDFGDGVTNNEAEYRTLIAALEDLQATLERAGRSPRAYHVLVLGDSELVIKQLNGQYKVKHPGMRPLYVAVKTLAAAFASVRFQWHPRARSVATLGH